MHNMSITNTKISLITKINTYSTSFDFLNKESNLYKRKLKLLNNKKPLNNERLFERV